MVGYDLALTASAAGGTFYSALTAFGGDYYLDQDKTTKSKDTRTLLRTVSGGILGLTTAAYIARQSSNTELKKAVLCSSATAFTAWGATNVHRVVTKKDSVQAKMDLAAVAGLGALCVAALVQNKQKK